MPGDKRGPYVDCGCYVLLHVCFAATQTAEAVRLRCLEAQE
jgi:hypothetical protein